MQALQAELAEMVGRDWSIDYYDPAFADRLAQIQAALKEGLR